MKTTTTRPEGLITLARGDTRRNCGPPRTPDDQILQPQAQGGRVSEQAQLIPSAMDQQETTLIQRKHEKHCPMAWHGLAWHGMAWHDMAYHGMAWRAQRARPGPLHMAVPRPVKSAQSPGMTEGSGGGSD